MFHIERGVVCRCGWHAEHYNRSHLADLYREHLRIVHAHSEVLMSNETDAAMMRLCRARIAELEAACERVARRTVDDWARTELERALTPEKPSSHE